MFSQPLRDLVFSMDLVQEAKQKKKKLHSSEAFSVSSHVCTYFFSYMGI